MTWNSSRKPLRTLVLLFALLGTAGAQPLIEVRSPSAKLIETAPGRIVTASVVVANRSGDDDEIAETLTLPEGCQKVAPPDLPFRLEGGSQIVRVLAIQVPTTMPAGRFDFRYTAQSRRDPSSIASIDLSISVTAIDNLQLVIEQRPDSIIAGDNYPIRLRATNHGNSTITVLLNSRSSLGYAVHTAPTSFALEPGGSREIQSRVNTDKTLSHRASHAVSFEAVTATASGESLKSNATAVAEVIPIFSGNRDPFHRFPMQFKTTALFESGREGQVQAELSGAGTLDEGGHHRVDFVFRGPDIQNANFFGERDEYGISYHGDNWDVSLGDRIYSLSPLTERHAFGRGAGVTWHEGPTTAGTFYMRTRHRRENSEEIGAFLRQELAPGFSLQGNFLRKWGSDSLFSEALPQNIFTLESHYVRRKELDLRLEAGVSRSDSGDVDFAYRAEARGVLWSKLTYAVEHTRAGSDFHGYYSDTETTYASLALPITDRLRAHASFNRYSGNLELNPDRSTVVNREHSWQTGLNFAATKKTDLSLQWQHVQRDDILEPAAYDFTEDSIRAGAGHNFGKMQLQSFVDVGTLENRLTGESGPFQRYSLFVNWQPTVRQSYSVFGTYGPSSFTGSRDRQLNVGASATWKLRDNLSATASYARNQYDSLRGRENDQAMAAVRYQFQNKNEIALIGRWTSAASNDQEESAIMISFTHPLSVPISRKTSIGTVRGRLIETTSGKPIARAIVVSGDVPAVTDSAGNFEFPSLKPGTHELRVVADSLGPDMVMATAAPARVKVRGAETVNVNLQAVQAASLAVRLTVFGGAPEKLRPTRGLNGGVVEISNGQETIRVQSDRTGLATFERLAAGRWQVRIADENLPPQHIIENAECIVDLRAGQAGNLDVRILPRRRMLKLIDQGAVAKASR